MTRWQLRPVQSNQFSLSHSSEYFLLKIQRFVKRVENKGILTD